MNNNELSSILEECICQLHNGADLEEVLARYPKYTRELRPLLETAASMQVNSSRLAVPAAAQARSRYNFLSHAAAPAQSHGFFHPLHLRLAITAITIVALVFGLLSTGLVSASALPGDTFYPVKLTLEQIQLSVASSTIQRLSLQDQFDERRAQEVNQLTDANRSANVTFSGIPAKMNGDWLVAGIKLDLTQQDSQQLEGMQGYVVQVTGETEGDTVKVAQVQPKELTISGKIDGIDTGYWVIAGVKVSVDQHLVTGVEPSVGQQVNVTAMRQNNGALIASTVVIEDNGSSHPVIETPEGGAINTPGRQQDQSENGKSDSHNGTNVTPKATDNSGRDRTPDSTPTPRYNSDDDSSTRQPQITEQHHDNSSPTPSARHTPEPGDTQDATPKP